MPSRIGRHTNRMNGEMMTIPTLEHVIEAVQTAVKKYPGGVRAMAAEMDMAPSSLGNVLNPYADRTSVKLGLEQAAFIMHQTGDVSALQLLAADLGFSLLPMCAEPDRAWKANSSMMWSVLQTCKGPYVGMRRRRCGQSCWGP